MQAAPLSFALVVESACVEGANVMRMNPPAAEYPASFVNVTTTLVTDLWAESSVEAMDNADVGNVNVTQDGRDSLVTAGYSTALFP